MCPASLLPAFPHSAPLLRLTLIIHSSASFCLTPLPHSTSLLTALPHFVSLLNALPHSTSLRLTPSHSLLLSQSTPSHIWIPLNFFSPASFYLTHPYCSASIGLTPCHYSASLLLTAFWAFCIMHQCLVALPPARNTDAFFRLSPANKDTFQAWTQLLLGKISFLSHSFPLTFPSLSLSLSITYRTHSALCSAVSLLPTFCPFCFLL